MGKSDNGNEKEKVVSGGEKSLRLFIAWTSCWIVAVIILALVLAPVHHPWWIVIIAIIITIIGWKFSRWLLINFVVPLYFAPRDIIWGFANEAEAGIRLKGGKYDGTFMNYQGFYLDGDFIQRLPGDFNSPKTKNRKDKKEKNAYIEKYFTDNNIPKQYEGAFGGKLGGIVYIGFPPSVHQVATFHQQIKVFKESEPDKMKEYDEYVRAIKLFLQQILFDYKPSGKEAIEDIDRVPIVGARIVAPVRIHNPNFAVIGVKGWNNSAAAVLWPIFENIVPYFSWSELIAMRVGPDIEARQRKAKKVFHMPVAEGDNLNDLFWNLFKAAAEGMPTYIAWKDIPNEEKECLSLFGAIFYKEGFRVYRVDPDPKFRADANKAYEEQKLGDATIVKAQKDGKVAVIKAKQEALAAAAIGEGIKNNLSMRTVEFARDAVAKKYGLSEEELTEALKSGLYKEDFDTFLEESRRLQAMDGDQFSEQVFPKDVSVLENALQRFANKK